MMYICELCGATCEGTPPDPELDQCPATGWLHSWIDEWGWGYIDEDEALED